ncbi:MAG: radical SAM protein [Denitrovibrio sp.]|nr:MAG: radical SAM protein [Denitrovibrio sp.]
MSDKYMMDTQKMLWHLDKVNDWDKGKRISPIHIDAGLSKGCNIRCQYCYGATQGNLFTRQKEVTFPREALLNYMKGAGEIGVNSIALIGEAEPTLNPYLYEAIEVGTNAGVDLALGTNGLLLDTGRDGESALENLTWLRFNISAATEEAYLRVHSSKDFKIFKEKVKFCVDTKRRKNLSVTIGLQMVLTPDNADQVVPLAKLGGELGVDYLVVKQCSDTRDGDIGVFDQLGEYKNFDELLKKAESYSTSDYKVIIKWNKITNEGIRGYNKCQGVPFLVYSSGDGKLYPCGMFFDHRSEEFLMGDFLTQSFKEIIESDRYCDVVKRVSEIDVHKVCYANCRTNEINEFLWKIKNPPNHVNFV